MIANQASRLKHSTLAWRCTSGFLVCTAGLTRFVEFAGFVGSYWFDMAFPAFLYIYLRKALGGKGESPIPPNLAISLAVLPAIALELLQLNGLYKGTFDVIDLVAYLSLAFPAYLIDRYETSMPE